MSTTASTTEATSRAEAIDNSLGENNEYLQDPRSRPKAKKNPKTKTKRSSSSNIPNKKSRTEKMDDDSVVRVERGNLITWSQKTAILEWLEIPANFKLFTGSGTSGMKQVTAGNCFFI